MHLLGTGCSESFRLHFTGTVYRASRTGSPSSGTCSITDTVLLITCSPLEIIPWPPENPTNTDSDTGMRQCKVLNIGVYFCCHSKACRWAQRQGFLTTSPKTMHLWSKCGEKHGVNGPQAMPHCMQQSYPHPTGLQCVQVTTALTDCLSLHSGLWR